MTTTLRTLLLSIVCTAALGATGSQVLPDERDPQVLEALLLHIWSDPKFDMTRLSTNRAVIVLHSRTPEKTGFLRATQMRAERGTNTWPEDAEKDLRRRNSPADAKPETYDCVTVHYTNFTFDSRILVADLTQTWTDRPFVAFREAFPNARGFLRPYLPGYSKNGDQALVRAGVGPSVHGAMLTALMERRSGRWIVKWYRIARFA